MTLAACRHLSVKKRCNLIKYVGKTGSITKSLPTILSYILLSFIYNRLYFNCCPISPVYSVVQIVIQAWKWNWAYLLKMSNCIAWQKVEQIWRNNKQNCVFKKIIVFMVVHLFFNPWRSFVLLYYYFSTQ